ncbi:MAG: AAA family ATPase [Elusimicrobia bacterium]|nr:AAA family ATPase [Elusimicrobiota bacterium]
MSFEEELLLLIKSGYPLIWAETYDENYVRSVLSDISKSGGYRFYEWSLTKGLCSAETGECLYDSKEPLKMVKNLNDLADNVKSKSFYALYDLDKYLDNPVVLRYFKEFLEKIKGSERTALLVSSSYKEIKDIYSYTARICGGYPDEKEILSLLNSHLSSFKRENRNIKVSVTPQEAKKIVRLFLGLTADQIRRIINKCLLDDFSFDAKDMEKIEKAKKEIFDKEGLLEYFPTVSISQVGGFENFKKWLSLRKKFFYSKDPSLPAPKGVLIMGAPGSGKSLSAKAAASELDIPLYRLDITRLYSKYIGETEENLRKAFDILSKLSPVCVWIDELEKIFSSSSGEIDGGVSKRVLGSFLTWLQEKRDEIFIVATSNDISSVPYEFLRKGRFDEIFFSPLPDINTREKIFEIHLKKRNISMPSELIKKLAEITEGFSGGEIEQAVISALYAKNETKPFYDFLKEEINKTQPLSVLRPQESKAVLAWAQERKIPYV